MSDKPKLLWHSNGPQTSTGYGTQTALFCERLKEHYHLAISAFYGIEGHLGAWKGIPVMPGIAQTHGNQTITEHARTFLGDLRGGLTVTLMDVWVLNPEIWRNLNVASWVPVDHEPAPDPVLAYFAHTGAIPIAMSKFGREQLADYDPLYVPHAVDTKVYCPQPKRESREELGLDPDAFIVGMVAANKGNPSRKCFSEAFQAFKVFHDKHPDSFLYCHSEATGRFEGVDLTALADAIGIPPDRIVFPDQYRVAHFPFPDEMMAKFYSSFDVLVSASQGEGFGLAVIEAQACGVPVIVSDFSAQPELVGAGWKVEGVKHYTPIGSWQFQPSVPSIVEALEASYEKRDNTSLGDTARSFAADYDIEKVMSEHMLPALESARERFADREPVKAAA